MKNDVELIIGAEDLLPEKSTCPHFFESLIKNAIAIRKFAADVDEREMTIDRERGDDDAFDELMRIALDNNAIFARTGLAFIGVAAQINRFAGIPRNETPLHS